MFWSCGPHLSGPIDHFPYVTLHKTPSLSLRENRIWQRSREAFEADAADRHQGGSGMTQTYDLVCTQCGTPLETGLRTGKVAEADGRRLTQALLRGCAVCAESGIKSNFTVKLDLSPLRADARRSEERRVGKECRCRRWP